MLSVNIEDLILIYLEGFEEFKADDEVPYALCPKEIVKSVGVGQKNPYDILNRMVEKELIEEDTRHVLGLDRKRNVYFLDKKGKEREERLWNDIKDQKVKIKTEDGDKKTNLENLERYIPGRNPIVKGLKALDENEIIDLTDLEEETEVFVGRKDELKTLKEKLKQAKKGGSRTVLIEGEAGIGKTSLVSRLKPFAVELGFKILSGTCQSQTSDPYLPLKEAFREYIENGAQKDQKAGMAFMGAGPEEKIEDKKLFDAKKKETFYESTKQVKEIAEKTPLVVFLDDLQWVDKATLDIMSYMDEKLEKSSVLFIGAYRPEDISEDHHLNEIMRRTRRKASLKTIKLDPLTYEDTEETVNSVLGVDETPKSFVDKIHDKTEGNPLFIKESLRQMQDENVIDPDENRYPEESDDISVSEMVYNVIERRVKRLNDQTIKVIEIGSVIGSSVPFDVLSRTAEIDEIDLLDHIDMLIGNQLWEEDPDGERFYFSHDLIRDAVYDGIKRLKRKLLHKKAAKNIKEVYKNEIENWYSDLAKHYEAAEELNQCLEYYIKAGEKAEEIYASEDAVELYDKALKLSEKIDEEVIDRLEIIKNIARALTLLGRFEETVEYLEKGLEIASDEKEKQTIHRRLAKTYYDKGEWDKSLEHINEGLSISDEKNSEKAELLSLKGSAYMKKGNFDKSEKIFEEEEYVAKSIGEKEKIAKAHHDLGTTYQRKGKLEESIDRLKKAIEMREEEGDILELHKSLNNIAIAYKDEGDYDKCREYFEKSYQEADKNNFKNLIPTSLNNTAFIYSEMGELEKAVERYEESIDVSQKIGIKETEALSRGNLANVYIMKGEMEKARDNLERSIETMKDIGYKYGELVGFQYLGSLNKKEGKIEEAERAYEESLDLAREIGSRRRESTLLRLLGDLYRIKGDFEKGKKFYSESEEVSQEIGSKDAEALVKDRLADIMFKKGDVDKALELHKEGLDISEEINDEEVAITLEIGIGEDYLEKDDVEKAEKHFSKARKRTEKTEWMDLIIRNQLLKSRIQREKGELDKAKENLQRELSRSRNIKDEIWESKVLYELGVQNTTMGEEKEARKYFNEALEMFSDLEMEWWRDKAQEKLSGVEG